MRFFLDFIPILLFFLSYKLYGIFVATAVAIVATLLQIAYGYWRHGKIEKQQLLTLIIISLFGGATLAFHNEAFIKIKPTIIYWVFALICLGSQFIGNKPALQRMMDDKLALPRHAWTRINLSCSGFLSIMGALNLYVVKHYSTDTWVSFKLFGTLILTLVFVVGLSFYVARFDSTNSVTH